MKEELLKIINHFGINNQQRKLQEEVFELQEAITLFEAGKGDIKNIIEELCDVYLLTAQIRAFYEIDDLEVNVLQKLKLKRTLERIESGYYDTKTNN